MKWKPQYSFLCASLNLLCATLGSPEFPLGVFANIVFALMNLGCGFYYLDKGEKE